MLCDGLSFAEKETNSQAFDMDFIRLYAAKYNITDYVDKIMEKNCEDDDTCLVFVPLRVKDSSFKEGSIIDIYFNQNLFAPNQFSQQENIIQQSFETFIQLSLTNLEIPGKFLSSKRELQAQLYEDFEFGWRLKEFKQNRIRLEVVFTNP